MQRFPRWRAVCGAIAPLMVISGYNSIVWADSQTLGQTEHCTTFTIFSGGSAFNPASARLVKDVSQHVSFIVPVSDNGGSSEEIRKAIGGVAVGDIRSRLLRVAQDSSPESHSVKQLLHHRLHYHDDSPDDHRARQEWQEILQGTHPLWSGISTPYKDTIRAFLLRFNHSVMKKAPVSFDFSNGSIGNFLFAGACIELASIEAAIFLVGSVLRVPSSVHVIPVVNSKTRLNICAVLENGSSILGQSQISHPSEGNSRARTVVNKASQTELDSPIRRILYVNEDAQETRPKVNPRALQYLGESDHIVYGVGSLYTSIVPSLVLEGVGECIVGNSGKKILMLNACTDRETMGMGAREFILAICAAVNRYGERNWSPSEIISELVYMEGSDILVDEQAIREEFGISCVRLANNGQGVYDLDRLMDYFHSLCD